MKVIGAVPVYVKVVVKSTSSPIETLWLNIIQNIKTKKVFYVRDVAFPRKRHKITKRKS